MFKNPRGAGGIFLNTKPKLYKTRQHFFHSSKIEDPVAAQCKQIQQEFLHSHNKHSKYQLKNINHIVTYNRGVLSLLQKTIDSQFNLIQSIDSPANEDSYILLKTIAHFTVWINILVNSLIQGDITMEQFEEEAIQEYEHLLYFKQATNKIVRDYLPLITATISLIDQLRHCSHLEEIKHLHLIYLQSIKSDNDSLGLAATTLQLNGIEKIFSDWLKKINPIQSRIIITGPPGPRVDMIETQFFIDQLVKNGIDHDEAKNHMVLYAPVMLPQQLSTIQQQDLINFLSTHELNKQIGQNMLGDSNAMNKDILAKHAPTVLQQIASRKTSEKDKSETPRCPYGYS